MEVSFPGLLLVKSKCLNLEKCLICWSINNDRKIKKSKKHQSKKLSSTDNGRRNLILKYSHTLQDNFLYSIGKRDLEHDIECIKYHLDTWYS